MDLLSRNNNKHYSNSTVRTVNSNTVRKYVRTEHTHNFRKLTYLAEREASEIICC